MRTVQNKNVWKSVQITADKNPAPLDAWSRWTTWSGVPAWERSEMLYSKSACMHAPFDSLFFFSFQSESCTSAKHGDLSRVVAPSLKRGAYLASSSNIANANHVYVCPTCCMFCPGATAGISVANANLPCMHALTWGRKCEKKRFSF